MENNPHQILKNAGIRPSIQRVAVYSYLYENKIHPDVETVYNALYKLYPSLSKTTVYNTLKLFEDNKIVQSIKIDDDKLRFDAEMKPHLHFKCMNCGKIFDIFSDSIESTNKSLLNELPSNFSFSRIQTNLWGTCSDCVTSSNS